MFSLLETFKIELGNGIVISGSDTNDTKKPENKLVRLMIVGPDNSRGGKKPENNFSTGTYSLLPFPSFEEDNSDDLTPLGGQPSSRYYIPFNKNDN